MITHNSEYRKTLDSIPVPPTRLIERPPTKLPELWGGLGTSLSSLVFIEHNTTKKNKGQRQPKAKHQSTMTSLRLPEGEKAEEREFNGHEEAGTKGKQHVEIIR